MIDFPIPDYAWDEGHPTECWADTPSPYAPNIITACHKPGVDLLGLCTAHAIEISGHSEDDLAEAS